MSVRFNYFPFVAPEGFRHLWKLGLLGGVVGVVLGVGTSAFSPFGHIPSSSKKNYLPSSSAAIVERYQSTRTGKRFAKIMGDVLERRHKGAGTNSKDAVLTREIVDEWMLSDPIECLNFLCDSSAEFLIDEESAKAAVQSAAGGNAIRAIDLARNLKSGRLQRNIISGAYLELVASNPVSALEVHADLPRYLQELLGLELATRWAKSDGRTAAAQVLNRREGTASMFSAALAEWAKTDGNAALAFLVETPQDEFHKKSISRESQLSGIFGLLEPENVVAFLESLPPSQFRDNRMTLYLSDLIAKNPAKLEEVIRGISGSSNVAGAIGTAAITASERDPASARKFVELIPGERLRGQVASQIASQMVQRNPKVAAEWAAGLSDPLTKEAALKKLQEFGVKPR